MDKLLELWTRIWISLKPYLKVVKIVSFLKSKTFLVIMVIIMALSLGRSCAKTRDMERKNKKQEQNIAALTDTIRMEKTKSGKQEVTIAGFVVSTKELEKLNKDLSNELKDQKGRVISLGKIIFQLKQDTAVLRARINYLESIMSQPIQINDSTYNIPWLLKYDWDSTNYDIYKGQTSIGITAKKPVSIFLLSDNKTYNTQFDNQFNASFDLKHNKTELLERTTQIDLTFGQEIIDHQLRVFVKTRYPGFSAKSLAGVLIDPNTNPYIKGLMKKKKWFPNTWSVGIGPSLGYNILTFKPYLGIGVNINYNLLQW